MARKQATVNYAGPGLRFFGSTGSGHTVAFDDEEGDAAGRPIEVLLTALGACSAMDVMSILRKKRQPVRAYRVRLQAEQAEEHPHVLTDIRVVHEVEGGGVEAVAVRRAVELSASRYCAISAMLASGVTRVSHWYVLRGEQPGDDDVAEVLVSGPHAEPSPSAPDVRVAERAAGRAPESRVAEAVVSIR
jgi:putative redox protein